MPSCDGIREEFIRCMLRSECVFIKRHSVAECVTNKELESRMRGVPNSGVKVPQKHDDSSKWDS
ncbi:hypothetical protein GGI13_001895 [Coemansia sp. RSA 455]|nr:hypothetical protein GGI13_001895 [Coemansia sp. RSA 455]